MKQFIAASLCMVLVAACAAGGAQKSARVASPPQSADAQGSPVPTNTMSAKDELDALFLAVERDRQVDQLPEAELDPASASTMPMAETNRSPKTDPTCKPAPSETCNTSCTLSGSICTNKDRICELAKDLGDADSIGKCNKATKTCKTAADKCCSCML
ncbi:MAG TPA: hypothetical protein VMZ53_01210 [Kofleriaceae bacterium]|nr:hypothetical protein [Kofleriaceae bacterium]